MKYILPENQSPWLEQIYLDTFGYKKDGFFVEIGVGHTYYQDSNGKPIFSRPCGSNVAPLADLGWNGILIEPHPLYAEEAKIRHKNNKVQIFNFAAGSEDKDMILMPGDTMRKEVQDNFHKLGFIDNATKISYPNEKVTVKEKNIQKFLIENKCPINFDILSVDTEGYEHIIFSTIDLIHFRPKVVVCELRTSDSRFEECFRKESFLVEQKIISQGYKKVFNDILNGVFVREQ